MKFYEIKYMKLKQEDVINKFIKIHQHIYDYSKFIYNGYNEKSIIICKKHGEFLQKPKIHYGSGCPKCKDEKSLTTFILKGSIKNNKNRCNTFIKSCEKVNSNLDFSKTEYINKNTKVIVTCKKHGDYSVIPRSLLEGKICRKCFNEKKERWSLEGWCISGKGKGFFYIIEMESLNEKFIKCGITNTNVKKRMAQITNFYSKKILFTLENVPSFCYILEKEIMNKFKEYQVIPHTKFGGRYECFTHTIKDEIIKYINDRTKNKKMKKMKYDFNDIAIVPIKMSDIDSRTDIDLEYIPIVCAPMDTLIDSSNISKFLNIGLEICMPRGEKIQEEFYDKVFHSFGIDEIVLLLDSNIKLPKKVLIDVANGNMLKLFLIAKRIKKEQKHIELMVGNIANPETYRLYCEIGVDWVRCGIGGGSVCTTSSNTGIHYPMASLIEECYDISCHYENPPKIIADGGFRNYDEIIKAIAIGAHSVMLGGILNKTLESCGDNYVKIGETEYKKITIDEANKFFEEDVETFKYYRGMSTKEVQAKWGRTTLKTAEGISKYNKVEYTLAGWTENFIDYLKSNMSYCGKRNLTEYKGQVEYIHITENARKRFAK